MNKFLSKLLSRLPRKLPVGMSEFDATAARIISLSGKYADEDSLRYVIATNIIHADAAKGSLSDAFFLNRMRKAAANQVASQVFQDIKAKQIAQQQAILEQQKQAEATATETVATDVPQN